MGLWKSFSLFGGKKALGGSPFTTELLASSELDAALKSLAEMSSGRRFNVLPEMRKAAKYLRTQHGARMRKHVSPDGIAWPKVQIQDSRLPAPRLDSAGPISGATVYNLRWAKLRTEAQVARSREIVERLNSRSASGKITVPALYRTKKYSAMSTAGTVLKYSGRKGQEKMTSVPVAGRLYAMLTKDRVAGSGTRIHAKSGSYELLYGLNATAAKWARIHQYGGGTFRGKSVARRPFIGMNQADVAAILRIFEDAKQRILSGQSSGSMALGA